MTKVRHKCDFEHRHDTPYLTMCIIVVSILHKIGYIILRSYVSHMLCIASHFNPMIRHMVYFPAKEILIGVFSVLLWTKPAPVLRISH